MGALNPRIKESLSKIETDVQEKRALVDMHKEHDVEDEDEEYEDEADVFRKSKAYVEDLHVKCDDANNQLLQVVMDIQEASQNIMKLEQGEQSGGAGYQAWSEKLRQVRARLRELNTAKTEIVQRIRALERKIVERGKSLNNM